MLNEKPFSDANLLTNELRLIGQRYKYSYGEFIHIKKLNYNSEYQLPRNFV